MTDNSPQAQAERFVVFDRRDQPTALEVMFEVTNAQRDALFKLTGTACTWSTISKVAADSKEAERMIEAAAKLHRALSLASTPAAR